MRSEEDVCSAIMGMGCMCCRGVWCKRTLEARNPLKRKPLELCWQALLHIGACASTAYTCCFAQDPSNGGSRPPASSFAFSKQQRKAVLISRMHSLILKSPSPWYGRTLAAAPFSTPNALITGSGMRSRAPPILKFCKDRCVCAPQYLHRPTHTPVCIHARGKQGQFCMQHNALLNPVRILRILHSAVCLGVVFGWKPSQPHLSAGTSNDPIVSFSTLTAVDKALEPATSTASDDLLQPPASARAFKQPHLLLQ